MIAAIDTETIPNLNMIPFMPKPKVDSRLKDPIKIAAAEAKGQAAQIEKMALDPLTARICCYAAVGIIRPDADTQTHGEVIQEISDDAERELIQSIMRMLAAEDARIVTWNGIGFDLPMIYKRAMLLNIDPGSFSAPPLPTWTKRYNTERHYDLMQIWGGWSSQGWEKLEVVAKLVLKEEREDIPYSEVPELLLTEEGRESVKQGCINHTKLTWDLFERFNGTLFV